jgi:peptide/nickel transport system ATP-binding protein
MRQRTMFAMALACNPKVLIADEPTTALDVTVQAQILELLRSLQQQHGMAMIFITHDLGVVAELCDDVLVMYAGRVAERAPVRELFAHPRHPYTQGLIHSVPLPSTPPKSALPMIEGVVPALNRMPQGCRFSNRCRYADDLSRTAVPPLETCGPAHEVACHHWRGITAP